MALFIQKPIFWNPDGYKTPSGFIATSGYPKETGYGHEEWNNSPRMQFEQEHHRYRVFHTEGFGNAPLDENAGQTFIFMTASHDGIQQLVGIAGNAICLTGPQHRQQREKITEDLSLHDLWKDAWARPEVQKRYKHELQLFLTAWNKDLNWIPNWICQDDFFLVA